MRPRIRLLCDLRCRLARRIRERATTDHRGRNLTLSASCSAPDHDSAPVSPGVRLATGLPGQTLLLPALTMLLRDLSGNPSARRHRRAVLFACRHYLAIAGYGSAVEPGLNPAAFAI